MGGINLAILTFQCRSNIVKVGTHVRLLKPSRRAGTSRCIASWLLSKCGIYSGYCNNNDSDCSNWSRMSKQLKPQPQHQRPTSVSTAAWRLVVPSVRHTRIDWPFIGNMKYQKVYHAAQTRSARSYNKFGINTCVRFGTRNNDEGACSLIRLVVMLNCGSPRRKAWNASAVLSI
jgi:hypothetical protein